MEWSISIFFSVKTCRNSCIFSPRSVLSDTWNFWLVCIQQVVKTGRWRKNIWVVQRENLNRWSISIPPRHSLIAPSGITTLADRWFNLLLSFWGTAWMLQCMSANTAHMCHDVLVTELVGFLGVCMKWMSPSMSRMNFCSFEKSSWLRSFVAVANITALYMYNLWSLILFKKDCLPMPCWQFREKNVAGNLMSEIVFLVMIC